MKSRDKIYFPKFQNYTRIPKHIFIPAKYTRPYWGTKKPAGEPPVDYLMIDWVRGDIPLFGSLVFLFLCVFGLLCNHGGYSASIGGLPLSPAHE